MTDTSSLLPTLFLWLPLVAIVAHMFEEFVWPGGFADRYFAALALIPPLLGAVTKGYAYWLVVAAIAGTNASFTNWKHSRSHIQ